MPFDVRIGKLRVQNISNGRIKNTEEIYDLPRVIASHGVKVDYFPIKLTWIGAEMFALCSDLMIGSTSEHYHDILPSRMF
jgi:hypothetical protein